GLVAPCVSALVQPISALALINHPLHGSLVVMRVSYTKSRSARRNSPASSTGFARHVWSLFRSEIGFCASRTAHHACAYRSRTLVLPATHRAHALPPCAL